ncbi:aKG-HExxH-type peptide beta-hydroxylase [Streptomyces eurythermus]
MARIAALLRAPGETTLAAEAERAGVRDVAEAAGEQVDLLTTPGLPGRTHQDFAALFRRHLGAGEGAYRLARSGPEQAAVARDAVALMRETAPELCAGLFQHARYLVAVDGPDAFDSASTREIPGAAFVALRCMRTPERLAEAMLHEFVHLRFYDLQMTRSVFVADYDTRTAPTVAPEWHRNSPVTRWPVDRALAAAHVYVHLAAWFERRARACPGPELERSARTADFRASSLLDKVARSAHLCLGPAGVDFLNWLTRVHQQRTAQPRGPAAAPGGPGDRHRTRTPAHGTPLAVHRHRTPVPFPRHVDVRGPLRPGAAGDRPRRRVRGHGRDPGVLALGVPVDLGPAPVLHRHGTVRRAVAGG